MQERLGEWDAAYNTWSSLAKLADDGSIKEVARAAVTRANDQRVIGKIVEAENLASHGRYASALPVLIDAAVLDPSPPTLDRLHRRYFELLGEWFAKELASASKAHQWRSLAIANFIGGSTLEGYSIRDHIFSAVREIGAGTPVIVHLPEGVIRRLQEGNLSQISDRHWKVDPPNTGRRGRIRHDRSGVDQLHLRSETAANPPVDQGPDLWQPSLVIRATWKRGLGYPPRGRRVGDFGSKCGRRERATTSAKISKSIFAAIKTAM